MNASIQTKCDELVAAIRADVTTEILAKLTGATVPGLRGLNGSPAKRHQAWRDRSAAAAERKKGQKRKPADIAKAVTDLAAEIRRKPGQRIEQIAAGMGEPTRDLFLPVKKLIAAKRIRTVGHKRARRYYPRAS